MASSSGQTVEAPFRLLDLPPEIRQIILTWMLVPPRIISQPYFDDSCESEKGKTKACRISWKILQTCRQLYDEGRLLLYGQNTFHVDSDPPYEKVQEGLWHLLSSASDENLALIQRVAVTMDVDRGVPSWAEFAHNLPKLYKPPVGLVAFRPTEIMVVEKTRDLWWIAAGKYTVERYEHFNRSDVLTYEISDETQWEPAPNGRPLHERQVLIEKKNEIDLHIEACTLHDAILALMGDMRRLDPAFNIIYLACAANIKHGLELCYNRIFLVSKLARAHYRLSNAFCFLASLPS